MKAKLFYWALGLLVSGALTAFAGEFPDSWTWDDKPEQRAAHAALEGKPMPAFHVSDWINGGITAAISRARSWSWIFTPPGAAPA